MDIEMGLPDGYVDFDPSKYLVHSIAENCVRELSKRLDWSAYHCHERWCRPYNVGYDWWLPGQEFDIELSFNRDTIIVGGNNVSRDYSLGMIEKYRHSEVWEPSGGYYRSLSFEIEYIDPKFNIDSIAELLEEFRRVADSDRCSLEASDQ